MVLARMLTKGFQGAWRRGHAGGLRRDGRSPETIGAAPMSDVPVNVDNGFDSSDGRRLTFQLCFPSLQ